MAAAAYQIKELARLERFELPTPWFEALNDNPRMSWEAHTVHFFNDLAGSDLPDFPFRGSISPPRRALLGHSRLSREVAHVGPETASE